MVNRHEERVTRKKRQQTYGPLGSELPGASDSGDAARRDHPAFRPVTQPGTMPTPIVPSPFYKIPSGSGTRRGPSYPAWERPPTAFDYPRLRGREGRRPISPIWPVVFTASGVAVVLFVLVVLPALMGHGGGAAVASPSGSLVASHSTGPSNSPVVTPSSLKSGGNGSPVPQVSYAQYQVKSGDTITKIAKKYGLKSWELLLANPDLASPDNLRIGLTLNIPQPGQMTPPTTTPTDSGAPS